jgi:hypothetical protein
MYDRGSNPGRRRDFSLHHCVQTGSRAHIDPSSQRVPGTRFHGWLLTFILYLHSPIRSHDLVLKHRDVNVFTMCIFNEIQETQQLLSKIVVSPLLNYSLTLSTKTMSCFLFGRSRLQILARRTGILTGFPWIFSFPPGYLKLGHKHFLPHPSQFTIH